MTPRELIGSLELADRRQRREHAAVLIVTAAAAGAPWSKADGIKKLYNELVGGD